MVGGTIISTVIVARDGGRADADLVDTLTSCGVTVLHAASIQEVISALREAPGAALLLELDDGDNKLLGELPAVELVGATRVIAVGDPRTLSAASACWPDCVLFANPDESMVRGALAATTPADTDKLLRELLSVSVFGSDLPATLQDLACRLVRAFDADDCVIVLPEEATCFTAGKLSEDVVADLVPLCQTAWQFATTVIGPPRPDRPYRAFFGVALTHGTAPPIAQLMLCREQPLPFGRDAVTHLRALGKRLSDDLSWRLIHERLLADRDRLRQLSRVDPVLGVANRTALQEELSRMIAASERRGEAFSVAVIDVDGLRLINERYGYPAGDSVLAHVAQMVRLEAGPLDMVARYAGDSIAIAMPGTTVDGATEVVTRVLSAIDATAVVHEDVPINLTVSAGIAEFHHDDDTGEAGLARAMAARDRARLHGEVIAVADATVVETPAQQDFAIGTTLGGVFQIRHEISRGAFGVVYRAEDLALGRQVALKLLRPDLARDSAFVENFRTEAATLARIRNPNLVQVYAFGIDGSNVFFAMELVEGQGLDKRIHSARKRRRYMPIPEVLGIIDQVAGALEAVHRAGMLHRDVKPDNVLIDRIHRRSVLVDVGISVRRGEKKAAGTPGFTAPEVFGAGVESPSTDVYSLAALAYMLLTLETPFGEGTPVQIIQQQAMRRPRPLTELRRDLPPGIDDVLLAALDPDPAARPQSARELAQAVSAMLSRPDIAPRSTVERFAASGPETRRSIVPHSLTRVSQPILPSTRGVLFRSAYEVLGARRGAAWIGEVSRKMPELAAALGPQGSSVAWYPTTAFTAALQSLGKDDAERRELAIALGKAAIASSFDQFYGADPSAVTPAQVLRAANVIWRCYHNWGDATVNANETDATVKVTRGIPDSLLCDSTAGLLAGAVAHLGGIAVAVEHTDCIASGAEACTFHLSWRLPTGIEESLMQTLRH